MFRHPVRESVAHDLCKPLVLLGIQQGYELQWLLRMFPRPPSCSPHLTLPLQFGAAWVGGLSFHSSAQRLQYPLIKEYPLNHIRDPTIIYGIFLN